MTPQSERGDRPDEWSRIFGMGADYRFVPFADHIEAAPVRLPVRERGAAPPADDRPLLSHQRPIPGGLSGRLSFELEATSPVLFGMSGGQRQGPALTVPARLSGASDAPYVIPGRAVRAMVRSVYRIATFSAPRPLNGNHRFGDRSPEYLEYLHRSSGTREAPRRGWLVFSCRKGSKTRKLEDYRWSIQPAADCPGENQIGEDYFKNELGIDFQPQEGDDRKHNSKRPPKDWHSAGYLQKAVAITESSLAIEYLKKLNDSRRHLVISGSLFGRKRHEAVFGYPDFDDHHEVSSASMADFLFINSEYSKSGGLFPVGGKRRLKENLRIALAQYAASELDGPELMQLLGMNASERKKIWEGVDPPGIPVYFYPDGRFLGVGIVFGLSELFKIPYKHTVGAVAERRPRWRDGHPTDRLDWTEALFGRTDAGSHEDDDPGNDSVSAARPAEHVNIGGRVSFAFAPSSNAALMLEEGKAYSVTQGAPKASFAPFYLASGDLSQRSGALWDDDHATLSGYKRYPAIFDWQCRSTGKFAPAGFGEVNLASGGGGRVEALVQPLQTGAIFHVNVDFRNLHPLELGALLWSVSFGDRAVFASEGRSRYRHVGGRLRGKGMGRLMPRAARLVNLRQNPMPEGLGLDALGPANALPDILMAAFEMEMGRRIAGGGAEDERQAFVECEPVRSLLNLSDSQWDHQSAGHENLDPLFRYPLNANNGRTDFTAYRKLRRALFQRSGVFSHEPPFRSVMQEFLKPQPAAAPTSAPRRPYEQNAFDVLFDPPAALRAWRAASRTLGG